MSDYELFYWPVPFRGQFIRAVLAFADKTWIERDAAAISDLMDGQVTSMPVPFMGPPVLIDRKSDVAIAGGTRRRLPHPFPCAYSSSTTADAASSACSANVVAYLSLLWISATIFSIFALCLVRPNALAYAAAVPNPARP